LWSDFQKLQAPDFSGGVSPRKFTKGFDSLPQVRRKPEIEGAVLRDRGEHFKTESALGNVQHPSTIIPPDLNENKFFERTSFLSTTFPDHGFRRFFQIFGILFSRQVA
jgi:hypothetical protein